MSASEAVFAASAGRWWTPPKDTPPPSPSFFPIIARADRRYRLTLNLFAPRGTGLLAGRLRRDLEDVRRVVHSTIVAGVVKRHVTGPLMGVALRPHGGVYFVSRRREEGLLRLERILEDGEVGTLTRIRVMGDARETTLLTEEIQSLVRERVQALREALEGPVGSPDAAARATARVKAARSDLAAMKEVFAFAAEAIEAEDRKAQGLLREAVTRAPRQPLAHQAVDGSRPDPE